MVRNYTDLYNLLIAMVYFLVVCFLSPYITVPVFLLSTLVVTAITMISGWKRGIVAVVFAITVATVFQVPALTQLDMIVRYAGFVLTSGLLIFLADKLRNMYEEARSNERRLKIINDSLSDVLITVDQNSTIVFVSPSVVELFGWEPEELLGKSLTILMPEALRDKHRRGVKKYLKTNKRKLDWRYIKQVGISKDGKEVPVEISFGEFKERGQRFFSAIIRDRTLQEAYEVKLEELASIVESTDDAIISKDTNGFIKTWNHGAEQLFGYTSEEAVGQHIFIIFPEEYKHEEAFILSTLRRGEKIAHYETVRKRKDGQLIDVSVTISPIKNTENHVISIVKIVRDITETKKKERETKLGFERYKTFIETSEEAIWAIEYRPPIDITLPVKDQVEQLVDNGYITEANFQMAELYGLPKDVDVVGMRIRDLPTIVGQREKILTDFVNSNYSIVDYENRVTQNGRDRYGSTSFKGIIEDGHITRTWVVQRETTDRKLQEIELEKAQERYKTFIENSQDGIWRFELMEPLDITLPVDEQIEWLYKYGYFAECNYEMAKMCGFNSAEDVIGKPLSFKLSKNLLSDVYLKSFISKNYELRNVESVETDDKGNMSYFTVGLLGVVSKGKLVRGWGNQRNISSAKKYAIERERLLAEAKEAKDMALLANKEKDRIFADLSHELRTPLVSIVGYSEILSEKTPKKELVKGLEIINRNGKAQLQLIEDLLAVSQATSGKGRLIKEEFNLKDLLKYRIDSFKYKYEAKNLKVNFKNEDLIVYADQQKISQIFNNIFSNAIKFTNVGEITVDYAKDADNSFHISIEDTGIGIKKKDIEKLFTPYFQVDAGVAKSKSGVGLGLYIAKTFTNLHKGRIEVESEIGKGSKFVVKIPLNGNDLRILGKTLEGTHVLLLEDDVTVGELMALLLERQGSLVTWVKGTEEADEILKDNKFDIYVFDIAMPKEDGISYIKRLRAKGDTTPSVAVSAYKDYEVEALKQGFNLFILKPLGLEKINELKTILK